MSVTCSCGATVPDGSQFCPKCGKQASQSPVGSSGGVPAPMGSSVSAAGGLTSNVAGGLAYITIIPAIIFLVMDPYNKDPFVRFNAWQSIFLNIAAVVAGFALSFVAHLMWFVSLALWPLVDLGFFILWLICLIKAFQNQTFVVPVIGPLAQQQAGK